MMTSKVDSGEDSSNGSLLRDIEEISKALYLHKTPPKALIYPSNQRSKSKVKTRSSESKSDVVIEDFLHKDKKFSLWNWKPLKALSLIRNHRFNCCFFLHVHTIEGLPSNLNDLSLCVNWKRKDEVLQTRPSRVCQGITEFEQTLVHRCSVYGSRNGTHNSAKYEPKLFSLYASVVGVPGLDIGKHWIDLTRLLPLTLEDLEEEKRSSAKWTTSFKLTSKAKGAMLNVSFGFSMLKDNLVESTRYVEVPNISKGRELRKVDRFIDSGADSDNGLLRRLGSVPSNAKHRSHFSSQSLDIKIFDLLPDPETEFARSVASLREKLDGGNLANSEEYDFFHEHLQRLKHKSVSSSDTAVNNIGNAVEDTEFSVIERGVEFSTSGELKLEEEEEEKGVQFFDDFVLETIDVAEIFNGDGMTLDEGIEWNSKDEILNNVEVEEGGVHINHKDEGIGGSGYEENDSCDKEPTGKELESIQDDLSISEFTEIASPRNMLMFLEEENYMNTKLSYKAGKMVKSLSLDDVTESVANDFLNALGIWQSPSSDSEPDSPRERLLRQYENEALASGNSIFNLVEVAEQMEISDDIQTNGRKMDHSDDFDLSFVIQAAEKEHGRVGQSLISKRKAKMLENLETEDLMQEWGLNEELFQISPRTCPGGFGSPVYIFPEERPEWPPLGEGLGPFIGLKAGGFLRSINPSVFRNAKNGASLIMQVSCPIVLPLAMGSSIMEILQCWASAGVEKLYAQANELMPLEDISGNTMQKVLWEASSTAEVKDRRKEVQEPCQSYSNLNSSSMSGKIDSEFVPLEDLAPLAMAKIEAPSIEGLRIQSNMSSEEAPSSIMRQASGNCVKGGSFNSKAAAELQRLHVEDEYNDVDELLSLSISLDEWVRLDAGNFDEKDETNKRTLKILGAHNAKSSGKPSVRKEGLLGNNLTVALMVQLRDPLRDHESVGAPMLALIQVERVHVPTEREIYNTESERSCNWEEDGFDSFEQLVEREKSIERENISRFKISEVHIAGLKAEPREKQLWGTRSQQQAGSRWLNSSGMGQTKNVPFSKSNAIVKSSSRMMRKNWDTLWSISSYLHGVVSCNWKEWAMLSTHARNPDIVFSIV